MKTIVITGASAGIGAAGARTLVNAGHRVVIVGRSAEKTKAVADNLGVDYFLADFTKLHEVKKLADQLLKAYPVIDVLINNAGYIAGERTATEDGHEATFQVNYLAAFLLTHLLLDRLIKSRATIISTSSIANKVGNVDLDDLENTHNYHAFTVYGTSKLENIMFTRELAKRFGKQGIAAAAFHPGVVNTNVSHSNSGFIGWLYRSFIGQLFFAKPSKAADTMVWLATAPEGDVWKSGEYYAKRRRKQPNKQAFDETITAGLWDRSIEMVKSFL